MRPAELNFLFSDISYIKGVGPKMAELLKNLFRGRSASGEQVLVKDLLFHTPVATIKREFLNEVSLGFVGQNILAEVTVVDYQDVGSRRPNAPKRVICRAGITEFFLVFFNHKEAQIKANLPIGAKRIVGGKLESFDGVLQIIHPDIILPPERINEAKTTEPIYPLTGGITNKYMQKIIANIFANIFEKMPVIKEWQNAEFIKQNKFLDFVSAIKNLHNPKFENDLSLDSNYRKRLAYDELLADQLAIAISRTQIKRHKGVAVNFTGTLENQLIKALPFQLTNAQKNAIEEIKSDFNSASKMFRLVQGDVGSGKTLVALISALNAIEGGLQVMFMAPTEILAQQHFHSISKMLANAGLDIKVELLAGSTKEKQRKIIHAGLEDGSINFLIGTHALFQERVLLKNLGLVIIDEQHRFGVKQRMQLAAKGNGVHTLLMSATPIPRTLSLTLYGDMDVTIVNEKPANRKAIQTATIPVSRIDEVIESVRRKITAGDQIYWVCPLVEKDEEEKSSYVKFITEDYSNNENIAAATDRFNELKKIFGAEVALVHGQMKQAEKDKAMLAFKNNECKILVATTVIEVGVDVPNATVIIIENAEKFGLAQLHQLRGRVGRGDKQSNCILLYANKISENSKQRLKIMRETEDGFRIAEEDLMLRGSGELLGTKQSGLPEYIFASLPEHKELLFAARDDAKYIMNIDSKLESERGNALRQMLYLFEYDKYIKNLQG
jgi:ATP-dependent DNA helicase RecG